VGEHGADEADRKPFGGELGQLGEMPCVLSGVGDDEVGAPEREPVDLAQDTRSRRAGREAGAVLDQRLVQRDEWVEEDRASAGDSPRCRHVEVPGIADDESIGGGVGVAGVAKAGACLNGRQSSTSTLRWARPPA